MNKIRLLLLIFLIISIGGCTPKGCSFLPKTSLTIIQYHLEKSVDVEEGVLTAQIEGVARNDGSAKLEYAEVIGKFYNQDGTLLATGVAKTTSEEPEEEEKYFTLGPGEIWEFTISYSSAAREAHPSLTILSYHLEKGSSEAKIVGQAQNDGDVILSFAQITGEFLYGGEAHPSLAILSCRLEKEWKEDRWEVRAIGEVQNDGDVMLSSAQIEVTFYDAAGSALATGTASIQDIDIGETEDYEIFYPGSNTEDVSRVIAEVTSTEYDEEETLLASSTASTTDLEVGETWDFSILYPKEDYEKVEYVTAEVDDDSLDYEAETYYESAEQVDHVTVKVGTLKGSTVMP
jgi:hypothetical protein